MKALLITLSVITIASVAWAEKPVQDVEVPVSRIECSFENIVYNWDFSEGDHGFTTAPCDDQGVPVWEWAYWDYVDRNCWMVGILAIYPNDSGESLISPSFLVDASTYLVDVGHGYSTEVSADGGNMKVNGIVVEPMEGYPDDELSDSTSLYAWCVDGEPGWTGYSGDDAVHSCFDLSDFMGQEVQLSFDFGSDANRTGGGWVIFDIDVGSDVVATEGTTWSAMKAMFR